MQWHNILTLSILWVATIHLAATNLYVSCADIWIDIPLHLHAGLGEYVVESVTRPKLLRPHSRL